MFDHTKIKPDVWEDFLNHHFDGTDPLRYLPPHRMKFPIIWGYATLHYLPSKGIEIVNAITYWRVLKKNKDLLDLIDSFDNPEDALISGMNEVKVGLS